MRIDDDDICDECSQHILSGECFCEWEAYWNGLSLEGREAELRMMDDYASNSDGL